MPEVAIRSCHETVQPQRCRPLPSLTRAAPRMASRFRRWRGGSGADYVVSVYPIERCPDYVDVVLIAVAPSGQPVWIGECAEGGNALRRCLAGATLAGAREVHVHLLAPCLEERRRIVEDLANGGRLPGGPIG
jgi:hypothetical protein